VKVCLCRLCVIWVSHESVCAPYAMGTVLLQQWSFRMSQYCLRPHKASAANRSHALMKKGLEVQGCLQEAAVIKETERCLL
jgi:hypothetical protein